MVIIPIIGGAVDYAVALSWRQRLVNVADAAALAVAVERPEKQGEATRRVHDYLAAHIESWQFRQTITVSVPPSGDDDSVVVILQARSKNTFLPIIGLPYFPITVRAVASSNQRFAEIALVLDNTGSMGRRVSDTDTTRKIDALRAAARDLTNILIQPTGRSIPPVRVGLVPFANAVNIGEHNESALWFASEKIGNNQWNGCVLARDNPDDVRDTRTPAWLPYLPIHPHNHFAECRKPSGSYCGCPRQHILPLTGSKADVIDAINGMRANGHTVIPQGIIWGWRLLSPNQPFNTANSYADARNFKYLIVMTDGENYVGRGRVASAYGVPDSSRLVVGSNTAETTLNQKTLAICRNARAVANRGENRITVITITFGPETTRRKILRDLMTDCASPPEHCPLAQCTYHAPTSSELQTAFAEIAHGIINSVRLTH